MGSLRYLLILIVLSGLNACKSGKIDRKSESDLIWSAVSINLSQELVLPNAYRTYKLNSENFSSLLKQGLVPLPRPDGSIAMYKIEDSKVMSEELQAKFPNINSYKGYEENNTLCQSRIDQINHTFKIVVFCNDATIYVEDLYDLGLYFVYYKNDLPEGIGTIKE